MRIHVDAPGLMPLSPEGEGRTARGVAAQLRATWRGRALPKQTRAQLTRLLPYIGTHRFYEELAQVDKQSATDWREMKIVQTHFSDEERGFDDRTQAYCEAMRLTLHAAVLLHLADPALRAGRSLFEAYLLLHVTAFHANGAWPGNMQIPWSGAFDVVRALPQEMGGRIVQLLPGMLTQDAAAEEAARIVQAERLEQSTRPRSLSA